MEPNLSTDSPDTDPSISGNNVPELLNSKKGGIPLMMGVRLTAPPPYMAPDKLPTFNIEDADLEELRAEKSFPNPTLSHTEWEPDDPQTGVAQWKAAHDSWTNPAWGIGPEGQVGFVRKCAEALGWDNTMSQFAAFPVRLQEKFEELYVAAPLMTK